MDEMMRRAKEANRYKLMRQKIAAKNKILKRLAQQREKIKITGAKLVWLLEHLPPAYEIETIFGETGDSIFRLHTHEIDHVVAPDIHKFVREAIMCVKRHNTRHALAESHRHDVDAIGPR